MKNKKDESGFAAFDLLIAAAVIGVLVVAGYFVFKNQNKEMATNSTTATAKQSAVKTNDTQEGWQAYESTDGYAIDYPKTWRMTRPAENLHGHVEITSPDYVGYQEAYSETDKGGIIIISVSKPYDMTVDAITNGTYSPVKSVLAEVKPLTIHGVKAVEYMMTPYEGPRYKVIQIDKGDQAYTISLQEMYNNSNFNDNIQMFEDIAQTFRFN